MIGPACPHNPVSLPRGFLACVRLEKVGASKSIAKPWSGARLGSEEASMTPSNRIIFAIATRRSSAPQIAVVVNMIEPLESLT
jgi:hypothetical protein